MEKQRNVDVKAKELHHLEEHFGWDCQPYIDALESGKYGDNPYIVLCQDGTAYLRTGWNYNGDSEILLKPWAVHEPERSDGWDEIGEITT